MKTTITNDYQGFKDRVLLEMTGDFMFRVNVEFDDEYVYPEFSYDTNITNHKILQMDEVLNLTDIEFEKRMKQLLAWMIDDFNYDQSIGVD